MFFDQMGFRKTYQSKEVFPFSDSTAEALIMGNPKCGQPWLTGKRFQSAKSGPNFIQKTPNGGEAINKRFN